LHDARYLVNIHFRHSLIRFISGRHPCKHSPCGLN